MRLIYLHQYFTTPGYFGGCRSYEFSKRLVRDGHDVDVITSTAFLPVERSSRWRLVTRLEIDGIRVHAIHVQYANQMSFARRLMAFFLFMVMSSLYVLTLRKRDLIFATSTPLTIGIPALVGRTLLGIPLVFEVRDLWPDIPVAMGYIKNPVVIRCLHWFEKTLYSKASKVVALSRGMAEAIVGKGVDGGKIVVIPNASDMEEFSRRDGWVDPLAKYRTSAETRICLYAGTFGAVNNVGYIVDLAAHLRTMKPEIKFVLIGDGAERKKIVRKIEASGLGNTVFLVGPVKRSELVAYIQPADACLSTVLNIPELSNNSANKFFDALAAGKPVIINYGGWQADVIERNRVGLVLSYNYEESARRLSAFFADERSRNMESHIRRFAEANYGREKLFGQWLNEALLPVVSECS